MTLHFNVAVNKNMGCHVMLVTVFTLVSLLGEIWTWFEHQIYCKSCRTVSKPNWESAKLKPNPNCNNDWTETEPSLLGSIPISSSHQWL